MNLFKIQKLDGRHNGVDHFTHFISYNVYVRGANISTTANQLRFSLARDWFWTTFGASCELNMFNPNNQTLGLVTEWAWSTDNLNLRIYVTESTLSHFMLAHSN
jgi:hypothetical protein